MGEERARDGDRPRISLLSKPGCHLCDDAREVIRRVADDTGVGWEEVDITSDPELQSAWWEQIPVTLVDGVQHDYWRVDETRLRLSLSKNVD
jgi:glutaredoxin